MTMVIPIRLRLAPGCFAEGFEVDFRTVTLVAMAALMLFW